MNSNYLKVFAATIILIVAIFWGGSNNNTPVAVSEDPEYQGINNLNKKFSNELNDLPGQVKIKFKNFLENHSINRYILNDNMFDFAKTSLVTLSETSIQIILVKKMQNTRSHDEAIFGFLRNNVVLPFFVVNEINTIGKNHFQIKLKSITGEVFLSYQVKNEKLLINELNTFPMNLSLSKIAPKEAEIQSRFTDCVKG